MSRESFVRRPGHPLADEFGMVPKHLAGPRYQKEGAASVISDSMRATRNMLDGKYYESKSKFRAATRAHGGEEVGTDKSITRDPGLSRIDMGNVEQDVKRAIQEIRSR